jgi:hypothetical protein
MLGSIFPGKLVFQDGKYRTEGMNPVLELILKKTKESQMKKPETLSFLKMFPENSADGRTRTSTLLPGVDFESTASAISPHRLKMNNKHTVFSVF